MIKNGYVSPFFRIWYGSKELTDYADRMSYTYDEKDDDECDITIRIPNNNWADLPEYQEKAELKVTWGFIGGPTKTRLVYVREPQLKCEKDSKYLLLKCTDKAGLLKSESERYIGRDGLIGAVSDIADKHNIDAYIEVPDDGTRLEALPGESTNNYIKRVNAYKAKQAYQRMLNTPKDQLQKGFLMLIKHYKESDEFKLEQKYRREATKANDAGATVNIEDYVKRMMALHNFRMVAQGFQVPNSNSVTQGGKSDRQFLNDLGGRTDGGHTLVTGRDNKLILRKRNFNQKPYRTFTWGDTEGELIEFAPETRNKTKKASAAAMNFAGWDALNKNFFSGTSDPSNPMNNSSLSKLLDMLRQGKLIQKQGGGRTVFDKRFNGTTLDNQAPSTLVGRLDKNGVTTPLIISGHGRNRIVDNSGNTGRDLSTPVFVPITVDDHVNALQKALDDQLNSLNNKKKEYYSSLGIDPNSAFNQASNLRNENELKKHPATIKIFPDPNIEEGIILTILGVGQKHSGNYYITKSTHTVEKGSGYELELEAAKNGLNSAVDDDYASADEVGRLANTQVGPDAGTGKTKTPTVKTNPK